MNSKELMDELFLMDVTADYTNTRDTFKGGDETRKIKKVGVCMFSPVNVLKEAAEWGADLLIVHESTYINLGENTQNDAVYLGKKSIVDEWLKYGGATLILSLADFQNASMPYIAMKFVESQLTKQTISIANLKYVLAIIISGIAEQVALNGKNIILNNPNIENELKDKIVECFSEFGYKDAVRPEEINVENFINIFNSICLRHNLQGFFF